LDKVLGRNTANLEGLLSIAEVCKNILAGKFELSKRKRSTCQSRVIITVALPNLTQQKKRAIAFRRGERL
jgi:hypothetical protein